MSDLLAQITGPISEFSTTHSARMQELSQNVDPTNLQQVTDIRMEWQKVTMAMQLQSALMSRLEKAIDSMISKM